jgi:3-dehydroquinate synthase
MPTTIRVALAERSYDIEIDRGNLARSAAFIGQRRSCSRAIVISDSNVGPLFGPAVAGSLAAGGIGHDLLTVPAGEESKSVAQCERLWNELSRLKTDRKTVVVALGGGVVGDLAGFIAATYGRGLAFVQIPTTLLAQVDSSVGGKVGINLPAAKNIVGAFWQPSGVLIDLDVLRALPDREYRSGLAEVVKYGVILDADFFAYLEENVAALHLRDPQVLEHVVATSCRLKATVVQQDEREETGARAVLNYGHTFCHAIETVAGYGRFLHGEAVAIGMICASRLAETMGRIDATVTSRQRDLLNRLKLPTVLPDVNKERLIEAMHHDKKTKLGRLNFVLPDRLGHVELVGDVDPDRIRAILNDPLTCEPSTVGREK